MPSDIDGPHNITVSADGKNYYITVAHGTPFGSLWKLDIRNDSVLGKSQVELFPTTVSLTPDGQLAFVANSDFHGDHPRMNVISVIHTPTMTKITDLEACDMPHGVKVNHAGTKVYVSCMHSDEILELDPGTFSISRRVRLGMGHQMAAGAGAHAGHGPPGASAPGAPPRKGEDVPPTADLTKECAATFVSVSPDDSRLYVACNYGNELQVYDAASLQLVKALPLGAGSYNVEPSPDGSIVIVTNKKDQSISIVDTKTLTELARVKTTKKIVHGVAYSPDGHYAYITQESIGADPGAVDVIDLTTRTVVSTIPIPAQPTGITILRTAR